MRLSKTSRQMRNFYIIRFWILLAAWLLPAGVQAGISADRTNYTQFWQEKIRPAEGKFFLHSTYQPEVKLSDPFARTVQEVMQDEIQKALSKGELKLDPQKQLAMTNKANNGYTSLQMTKEVLEEFAARASEGFKDFLQYVGRPDYMPNLQFRLLEEDTEFQAPTTESAVMYLAWNRNIRVWSWLHYAGQKDYILRRQVIATDPHRGQLVGILTGSFDEDKGVNLQHVMQHAYGGVGYSAISSYAVPMSELFPLFLRPFTAERVNTEINQSWTKMGKPLSIDKKEHQRVIKKWDVREDSLIEGLIDEFIGTKLDELGFTKEDWSSYCKHGNSDQYALSPVVKNKIRQLGAPEVLRLYIEEPDKLFCQSN